MPKLAKQLITRLRFYWLADRLYEAYRLLASYRRSLSLPGGGIERGETARQAAVRELAEELGLLVDPTQLEDPWQLTEASARGKNSVTIFTMWAAREPVLLLDGLELVASHWLTREEALSRPLVSHVRAYLEQGR
jgi:8-oxo-dGTP pyrophosphatase MutT (NUDIX family)